MKWWSENNEIIWSTHWRLAMNFRISCWAYCLSLKNCWFGLWPDMHPEFLNTHPITLLTARPEIRWNPCWLQGPFNAAPVHPPGAYPPDNPLPRYAASNHQAYALRHGYRALAVWKHQSILHHNELEGNGMTSGCCADGWCCFSRGYRLETEKVSPERPPAWGDLAGETHGRRNAAEVKIVVHLSDDDSIWFMYPGFVSVFFLQILGRSTALQSFMLQVFFRNFLRVRQHTHHLNAHVQLTVLFGLQKMQRVPLQWVSLQKL